jgi:hypothetical protein
MSLLYQVSDKAGPHTTFESIGFVPRVPPIPLIFENGFQIIQGNPEKFKSLRFQPVAKVAKNGEKPGTPGTSRISRCLQMGHPLLMGYLSVDQDLEASCFSPVWAVRKAKK